MSESSRTDTDQLTKTRPPAEPMRTVSEKLFEAYLTTQGLQWEHEPPLGRKRPDYSIQRPDQTTIIEVKEFSVPSKKPVGGFSMCPAIQRKLDEARPQLAEFKNHPCGIVLHSPSHTSYRFLDLISTASACFGQCIQSDPPFDGKLSFGPPTYAFRGKAALRPECNTTLSAVLLLMRYQLDELWLAVWRELWAKQETGADVEAGEQFAVMERLAPQIAKRHRFENTVRLVVLHNPHARLPVSQSLFCGPFDQQWAQRNGRLELVWSGETLRALSDEGVPFIFQ